MAQAAEMLVDRAFCLTLAADPVAIRESLARVAASGPLAGLSDNHRAKAEIVLAEVLNNITEHAYSGRVGEILLCLVTTPAGLDCLTEDRGAAMPAGGPPKGTLPEEDFPEGGFGWFLIRSLTCGLVYQRRDDRNILHFIVPP